MRGALAAGVGHIAEDRHRRGLVLDFSLAENMAMRAYRRIARMGLLSPKTLRDRCRPLLEEYDVRGGRPDVPASSLSGGNQQKVVIAREIAEEPRVLLAAQPTRGLDVGAIEFVHRRLLEQRAAGRGVLLVSLELEEIRALADRVLVLYEGRIVAELPPDASDEELGVAMTGGGRAPRGGRVSDLSPGGGGAPTVASRLSGYLRGGGVLVPVITVLVAFVVAGVFMIAAGADPLETYNAILTGSGLNWFFPWISSEDRTLAALNLQQTLLLTAPLILVGLAVAFAFRAGLFNIGGQGQYIVGSVVAVWVGSSFAGMPAFLHIVLAVVLATLAGAFWAGIAGFLKATTGANEVISTIMLNYTAIWIGVYLFTIGGPLQSDEQRSIPVSNDIVESARLPVFWGDPELQGLHVGIFIAVAALLVFWVVLNRSVTGFEVRAVGFNPDAAEYGGISAARNYVKVMAICGAFAGLAGAMDILGWQFRLNRNDIEGSTIGFLGIAVALLGRNTALGTAAAALLFAALVNGTSVRNLDPEVFDPLLATNLTTIIQGLVVLFVSAPVLVPAVWNLRRRLVPGRRGQKAEAG